MPVWPGIANALRLAIDFINSRAGIRSTCFFGVLLRLDRAKRTYNHVTSERYVSLEWHSITYTNHLNELYTECVYVCVGMKMKCVGTWHRMDGYSTESSFSFLFCVLYFLDEPIIY